MQYGHELATFRERRFWSRQMLADRLGVSVVTIFRWEKGDTLPKSALLRLRKWQKALAADREARLERSYKAGRPAKGAF
jgi:ribosome-binding protein aMBF1 (putative translation factor)